MILRIFAFEGPHKEVTKIEVTSKTEALDLVTKLAAPRGFTKIKVTHDLDDPEGSDLRITGTTPGGRGGRNLAYLEWAE